MSTPKLTIEVYKSVDEWRWRAKSKNGKIIATGGEGYHNKQDMIDTLIMLQFELEYATIKEVKV